MPSTIRRRSAALGALTGLTVTGLVLSAVPAYADAPPTADNFRKLRMCESGGDYQANTGNGYYGAYQFDLQTWHSLGLHSRPDQAHPATQDSAARELYNERGWQPWPACSRQEGLSS